MSVIVSGEALERLATSKYFPDTCQECLGVSSIDMRLGGEIIELGERASVVLGDDGKPIYTNAKYFDLKPGERFVFRRGHFYIVTTVERVDLPPDIAGLFFLRSSSGRRGLDHAHAGYIDTGFRGTITGELIAHVDTEFEIGSRFAQLILIRATDAATYMGQYVGQDGPTLAMGGILK